MSCSPSQNFELSPQPENTTPENGKTGVLLFPGGHDSAADVQATFCLFDLCIVLRFLLFSSSYNCHCVWQFGAGVVKQFCFSWDISNLLRSQYLPDRYLLSFYRRLMAMISWLTSNFPLSSGGRRRIPWVQMCFQVTWDQSKSKQKEPHHL